MGRRGPPRQPTHLRLLRGNPGKRRIDSREPRPEPSTPACPRWLRAEAKKVWRRTVPELRKMGILTRADRDALTVYCQVFARWRDVEEFLRLHGEVYPLRNDQGNVVRMKQFPHVAIAANLLQVLRSYQQEFGMTPSARTRVRENPKIPEDPTERRFFGPH